MEINIEIDNSKEDCIICYNEYNINDGIIFECSHKICIACYQTLLNNISNLTCPVCRRNLDTEKQENIQENTQHNSQHNSLLDILHNYCKCVAVMLLVIMITILIMIIIISSMEKN